MGIKKSVILWRFQKVCCSLVTKCKMQKTSYLQKTAIFLKKMAESKPLLFFVNNSFQVHFVTELLPTFWNLHKITNFFMPIKSYFQKKKISDLIKQFFGEKIAQKLDELSGFSKYQKTLFLFQSQNSNQNPSKSGDF